MSLSSQIDAYFDNLVEPSFQRDEQGREVFFPMGLGTRGRIVPDAATGLRLRTSMKQFLKWFFGVLVGLLLLLTFTVDFIPVSALKTILSWGGVILVAAVGLAFMITLGVTRRLASGLEVSARRMSVSNQTTSVAEKYSERWVYSMIGSSIALAGVCGWSFLAHARLPSEASWLNIMAGVGAVFFTAIAGMWLRIAFIKRRPAK
jgi:hypothetical protein